MFTHNEGIDESSIMQNKFTAYLTTAIQRKKIQYLRSKTQKRQCEQSLEIPEENEALSVAADISLELPFMEQIENVKLHKILKKVKIKDLYILFSKALENRSFVEIAAELDIKPNTAAMIYYRLIKILKNELRGETI